MNILDKIVDKKREVILKKSIIPVSQASVSLGKKPSLSQSLRDSSGNYCRAQTSFSVKISYKP
jgi:indole-3-glycerol phosphate synthase